MLSTFKRKGIAQASRGPQLSLKSENFGENSKLWCLVEEQFFGMAYLHSTNPLHVPQIDNTNQPQSTYCVHLYFWKLKIKSMIG